MTDNSLLPPNATSPERALAGSVARIGAVDAPIEDLRDPDKCPAQFLPFLAWALGIRVWDGAWTEATQRKVVAAAIATARARGTPGGMKDALAALDVEATVERWFEYGDTPYRFKVDIGISTRPLTDDDFDTVQAVIDYAKNERDALADLKLFLTAHGATPKVGAALCAGEAISVFPHAVTEVEASSAVPVMAFGEYGVDTTTIFPQ